MHLALKIAIDKPTCPSEARAVAALVNAMNDVLVSHDVTPVTWFADENDTKLIFEAYVPADCLPELDQAADFLAECYAEFNTSEQ